LAYTKYYNIREVYSYSESARTIFFTFERIYSTIDITLDDFIFDKTTSKSLVNNVVVGTLINGIYTTANPGYYMLTTDNSITVQGTPAVTGQRLYPVITRRFFKEKIAEARFEALLLLSDNRFVDNIILNNINKNFPINLDKLQLLQMIKIYVNGKFYKTLPIAEQNITYSANEFTYSTKLGFKKILLTEFVKKGG